jgi:hypothetical protein
MGFRLLRSALGFTVLVVLVIIVFPIIVIAFAELGYKALVKEVLASRKRPSTHIDNVALFKIGLIHDLRLWIDIHTFGREYGFNGLGTCSLNMSFRRDNSIALTFTSTDFSQFSSGISTWNIT